MEKMCLVKFVQENKHILEDTCKCGTMRLQRKKKWIEFSNTLLSLGYSHGWKELRMFYKALKYKAKNKVEAYHRSDDKRSLVKPDKVDYILAEVCSMESKMSNRFLHECQLQGRIKNSKSISKKKYNQSAMDPIRLEQQKGEIVSDMIDTSQAVMAVSLSESRTTETVEKQSCAESLLELHKKQWNLKLELQIQEHEARMALLREEERRKKMLNDYALEEKKMRIAILQKQFDKLYN